MIIKDHNNKFLYNFELNKVHIDNFFKQFKINELSLDLDAINVLVSKVTLGLLNERDTYAKDKSLFSWSEGIIHTSNAIGGIAKASGFCKLGNKNINLEEYYFWNKMTNAENKYEIFREYLISRCTDRHSNDRHYKINQETIQDMVADMIFYLNEIEGGSYLECLKSYLYPAVDLNIDYLSILKDLEKDVNNGIGLSRSVYDAWASSSKKNSKCPDLFKYLFDNIKRSSGYVQEKMALISQAFSNGAVDKKLAKLFIKKSTIRIRRELAQSFASLNSSVLSYKNNIDRILREIDKDHPEYKEKEFREVKSSLNSLYRNLHYYSKSIGISHDPYAISEMSFEELKEWCKSTLLLVEEKHKISQTGLIYISEEKDYQVQECVVNNITKENSIWVLPNIHSSYHKRIINNKIVGV
jgi:hypothetical protein